MDENERQNGAANHVGEFRETFISAPFLGVKWVIERQEPGLTPLTHSRHTTLQLHFVVGGTKWVLLPSVDTDHE